MFLCGTGVQISPVIEIDHRPIGSGEVGPIATLVRDRYFDAVRGRLPEYRHWLTEIPADGLSRRQVGPASLSRHGEHCLDALRGRSLWPR